MSYTSLCIMQNCSFNFSLSSDISHNATQNMALRRSNLTVGQTVSLDQYVSSTHGNSHHSLAYSCRSQTMAICFKTCSLPLKNSSRSTNQAISIGAIFGLPSPCLYKPPTFTCVGLSHFFTGPWITRWKETPKMDSSVSLWFFHGLFSFTFIYCSLILNLHTGFVSPEYHFFMLIGLSLLNAFSSSLPVYFVGSTYLNWLWIWSLWHIQFYWIFASFWIIYYKGAK